MYLNVVKIKENTKLNYFFNYNFQLLLFVSQFLKLNKNQETRICYSKNFILKLIYK